MPFGYCRDTKAIASIKLLVKEVDLGLEYRWSISLTYDAVVVEVLVTAL